ncbi:MAG: alanine racemase [Bryobacterales bacterium]|nr:alanine racemase [Bryobacterales bacterium]
MESTLSQHSQPEAYPPYRTFARISLSQLAANYASVESALPAGTRMMPVVKANAYGHGAVPVAEHLVKHGARWLAVSSVEEGVELRTAGIVAPVRIVVTAGVLPFEWDALFEYNLTPVLHSFLELRQLDQCGRRRNQRVGFHFKLDTGLSRLGTLAAAGDIAREFQDAQYAVPEGLMTHLASASEPSSPQTLMQLERFQAALSSLRERGVCPPLVHIDATSSLHFPPHQGGYQLARPGLAIYGYTPAGQSGTTGCLNVAPVLSWHARVLLPKRVPEGSLIGYGGLHRTKRPTTIAVLAVGYGDGYFRCLSQRGRVLIRGASAPILGAISMDLTTVDVTDIPDVSTEDLATLLGSNDGAAIDAAEIAEAANTIPYEVLTNIHKRVKRVYTR